jgi:hypothetical protein
VGPEGSAFGGPWPPATPQRGVMRCEEWRSWTTIEDLERTAGELLYARVWALEAPAW